MQISVPMTLLNSDCKTITIVQAIQRIKTIRNKNLPTRANVP